MPPSKSTTPPGTVNSMELARPFTDLPDNIISLVLGAAPPLTVKKGASLFERGDAGGTMYVVQQGKLEISIVTEAGRKMVLNMIGPGQCVGEISMIDRGTRTASAVAIEETKVFPVSRTTFLEAVRQHPQLSFNLMEILCERLRWVSSSVEEYALHPFELRLARRLLMLKQKFGDSESVGVTQNDLADFAGATRESVNKTLMQWKQDELIEVQRGRIFLKKTSALERIAYGDTAV